jgi:hypothetical protein
MVIDLIVVFGLFVSESETFSRLCNDDVRTGLVFDNPKQILAENLPPQRIKSSLA